MKFLVCVKQVPDTNTKIQIKGDKSGIETAGIKWVLNPYDEFAVEEAIKLRDANAGSQLFVLSVGPKARIVESLRTALAMGADEGILVDAPENLDVVATAKALVAAAQKEGPFDAIFTGKLAIDDNQGAVTQMLAEGLNLPHANVISKFEKSGANTNVEREIEGGAKEVLQVSGAAVFGANKGLNNPRYASLPGIMKAKKKTIKEYALADVGVSDADIKTRFHDLQLPPDRPQVKILKDNPAQELVRLLREEAKVI